MNMTTLIESYPLSPTQKAILFRWLAAPDSDVYLQQLVWTMREELDAGRFQESWRKVAARHKVLRTSFRWEDLTEPVQEIATEVEVPFTQLDLSGLGDGERESRFDELRDQDRRRGIDLSRAPNIRLTVVRMAPAEFRVIWTYHHAVLDAHSRNQIVREVLTLYDADRAGVQVTLPPAVCYRRFTEWLRQRDLEQDEAFWRRSLADAPAPGPIPGLRVDMNPQRSVGPAADREVRLSAEATNALRETARENGFRLSTLVHGAWALLLSRYSDETEVVLGTTSSGRSTVPEEISDVVGPLINTLPLRVRIEAGQPLVKWLHDLRRRLVEVREHEHAGLAAIRRWNGISAESRFFHSVVVFNHQLIDRGPDPRPELWENRSFRLYEHTEFPLLLQAYAERELLLRLEYDRSMIDDAAVERILGHLEAALRSMAENPDQLVGELPLLLGAERDRLEEAWASGRVEIPFRPIHEVVAEHASRTPDATAIEVEGEGLTYAEVDRRAERLARCLRAVGVGTGSAVGLFLPRTADIPVGVLGILKAGAAYVPLDPEYPPERTAFILADSQVAAIVSARSLEHTLPASGAPVLFVDDEADVAAAELPAVSPDDVAYVMYTSGTTGRPKGVMVTHGNISNYVTAMAVPLGISAADRYLLTASIAFSSSVRQLMVPLSQGATVVVATYERIRDPQGLFGYVQQSGATVIDLVPSYARQCIDALRRLAPERRDPLLINRVRLIVSASEPLPREVPRAWREWFGGGVRLVNMFGQTETAGIVTLFPIEEEVTTPIVPIGRPIANMRLYVLDPQGRHAPIGMPGEIHVAGADIALGYVNLPDLTREFFRPDPFFPQSGERMYCTGDRGRMRPDGTVEFLGRADRQVKIRGFRVEVEEVEAALREQPDVRECAVMPHEDADGDRRLVAYVVGEGRLAIGTVREALKRRLAGYMVPAAFVQMAALPRLPNGKVDRGLLPAPAFGAGEEESEFVAPRTPVEEILAGIWASVLEVPRVGVYDDFFALGGHSLKAMRVAARIHEEIGVEVPVRSIFEVSNVAALAMQVSCLRNGQPASGESALAPVSRDLPLPLSAAQERLWVLHQMEPDNVAYNLSAVMRLRGPLNGPALMRSLSEVVRRHEALRTVFPTIHGTAAQSVQPPASVPLPVIDLGLFAPEDREAEAQRLAREEIRRPFDLARGPLFRAVVLKLASEDHLLVLSMHHIISDGWSRGVLYGEVARLYDAFAKGEPSPLPEIPLQFADFAVWQRESLQNGGLERSLEYWSGQLSGSLPVLDLPTDRPRPAMQSFRGATHHFSLSPALERELRSLARSTGTTLYMALLAGIQTLLHRYSGQDDILVGSPTAGRTRSAAEGLIGFFVNTLVMRSDFSGDPTFRQLLGKVRETTLDAYAHQDLPFEQLVDALHIPRDLSRSPLFQVMFILQNEPREAMRLEGLEVAPVEIDHGASKFDLTLSVTELPGGLVGSMEYNTDLFDASTIDRMVGHLESLLAGAAEDPDRPVSRLPLLTSEERQRMLVEWNDTAALYPRESCVHQLIEAQVDRTPDAPALVYEGRTLTYREMDERANQVAHRLRALGVGPDVLVGVYLERSIEMMVGLLGIHKAGGAYVPLDPAYPVDRVALMVEDSGARVILTQPHLVSKVPADDARILVLDPTFVVVEEESTERAAAEVSPDRLAYVIYTSGSTGRPKGVMVEHRNVVNFFAGMDERIGTEPGTWLAVTSISFDISVLELFWTLARGYKVVIQGDDVQVRVAGPPSPYAQKAIGFSLFYFAGDGATASRQKYRLLLEGAKFADRNGFEAVWTPERHFHAFGGLYPNPAVTSAALAGMTERVQLRAGSVVLPLHDTIRVAEEWAVVDNISGGRVGIAVASGWHDRDFVFAPQNYANRREVLIQQVDTLRRLWKGESIRSMGGAGKEVEISILPRPVQPELPIWVTAAGSPETFVNAGKMGCRLLTHLLGQSVEQLQGKLNAYRQAWREAGHPGEGHVTLMMHTYIGEDQESARATVYHPFREYLRTSVDLISKLAEGRGQDIRSSGFSPADMDALLDHAFERYYQTSALLGTVESCSAVVDRLKGIGVDEIACLIDFGVDEELALEALERLAELRRKTNPDADAVDQDYSLPAQLARHSVTHLQCTPSMATMLLAQPGTREAMGSLRTVMLGGEAFPSALAADLREVTPARIINMYGPTETTIWSSTYAVNGSTGQIPIGTPIANTAFYILDRNLQPVPQGVAGELFIGGDGVVRGYLKRPELTGERFVQNPFGDGRLYRTGDLVRWRPDASVEFLGRTDYQVKIRGHRIELGEIEALLQERADVREAVVLAREDVPGDKRLVAYLVAQPEARLDTDELRRTVKERLPDYMVPAHFVVLPDFPRTPNAKIDRKALPAPHQVAVSADNAASPEVDGSQPNEVESRITDVWKEVLRVPAVGRQDNFFDLGGNSLLTIKVQLRLGEVLGRPVPLTDLFRFPTVRSLAEHLGAATGNGTSGNGTHPAAASEAEVGVDRAEMRRAALRRRQHTR